MKIAWKNTVKYMVAKCPNQIFEKRQISESYLGLYTASDARYFGYLSLLD